MELKSKLIDQFSLLIEDDSKLVILEGVFDSMLLAEEPSKIPDTHYDIIRDRRSHYLSGDKKPRNWDEVKIELKKKYGL